MSVIVTVEDAGFLERAEKMLSGINGGFDKALRRAATRSTAHLRTQSVKAVQERYAISAAAVRSERNIHVRYSYGNGVQATVTFSGRKIPLARFSGSSTSPSRSADKVAALIGSGWKQVRPSNPARGHQLKGTAPTTFNSAFVAKMASGHVGIFERTGGQTRNDTDELRELMGSSIPQMLGNEEVQEKLAKSTMEKFEERLDHEVLAILNGWGK